ncbi:transmembrane and coiled-coil domains protein 3 [Pelomyxa schiedti]|nr:transmembrane and coiled-coil domains protein 3 [Pelomyxa schiedti]
MQRTTSYGTTGTNENGSGGGGGGGGTATPQHQRRPSGASSSSSFASAYETACAAMNVVPLTQVLAAGTNLDLSRVCMSSQACAALGEALKFEGNITSLDLSDTSVSDTGCSSICEALKSNNAITSLNLRGNNIRQQGAIAVAELLKNNSAVTKLSLEWNTVGLWDQGIEAMSEALTVNKSLVYLDLRNNRISPQATSNIAHAMQHNTTLTHLDLRWNNMGIIGGKALVQALKHNFSLTFLDVAGNEVPADILQAIEIAILRNREIGVTNRMCLQDQASCRMDPELDTTTKSYRQLEQKCAGMKQDSRAEKNKNRKLQEFVKQLQEQNKGLSTQISELHSTIAEKEKQFGLQQEASRGLEKEVDQLHKTISQMERAAKAAEAETKTKLQAITGELQKTQATLSSTEKLGQQLKAQLSQEKERYEQHISEQQQQLSEAQKKEVNTGFHIIHWIHQQFTSMKEITSQELSQRENIVLDLQSKLNDMNAEITALQKELEAAHCNHEQLITALRNSITFLPTLIRAILVSKEIQAHQIQHITELQSLLARSESEGGDTKVQLAQTEAKLQNEHTEKEKVLKELELMSQYNKQTLENQAAQFAAKISAMESRLAAQEQSTLRQLASQEQANTKHIETITQQHQHSLHQEAEKYEKLLCRLEETLSAAHKLAFSEARRTAPNNTQHH